MTSPATYALLDDLILSAVLHAPVQRDDMFSLDIQTECKRLGPILGVDNVERLLDRRIISLRRTGRIRSRRRYLMLP